MKKIVVTGGAGMIGSNLVSALSNEGFEVVVIDDFSRGSMENLADPIRDAKGPIRVIEADLSLPGDWAKEFTDADAVYHLADIVAGVGYVFDNEGAVFRQNLLINATVANAVAAEKPKRYIYVGTACSFPLEIQTGVDAAPMREDQQYPANPESGYGWSKLMGEIDAKYLENQAGVPSVVLVLHNVYGAPCEFEGPRTQAIPALIHRALSTTDDKLVVWGSGQQGRAFLHVDDVVSALRSALDKGHGVGPIQIGPDVCTSIAEIAQSIIDIVDRDLSLDFDRTKPEGDRGRCADYSKAREILGWEPTIKIGDGLRSVKDWVEARMNA